jgi:hypothetical protein
MRKVIGSVGAAAGWRAVYENARTEKLDTLPVAYWNRWEEPAEGNDGVATSGTVGVVNVDSSPNFAEADDYELIQDRKLVGYAAPGEMLTRWEKKREKAA